MNPLVLIALGLGAMMVLGRKRPATITEPDKEGELPPPEPPEEGEGPGPIYAKIIKLIPPELKPFFSKPGQPQLGTFYPVGADDVELGVKGIAALVLYGKRPVTAPAVHNYAVCINDGDWNGWGYGEESYVPEASEHIYAGMAFEPINENAMQAIADERWIVPASRGTTIIDGKLKTGQSGHFYGLLWLPPAELFTPEVGAPIVHCAIGSWPDGTSTINPPPLVLQRLKGPKPDWVKRRLPVPTSEGTMT